MKHQQRYYQTYILTFFKLESVSEVVLSSLALQNQNICEAKDFQHVIICLNSSIKDTLSWLSVAELYALMEIYSDLVEIDLLNQIS